MNNERRFDLLVGALEGGSNYWYYLPNNNEWSEFTGESLVDAIWKSVLAGNAITINDAEEPEETIGKLSMMKILEGEEKMKAEQPRHWANLVNEEDDAETADVWFQYCCLGEIVYG
jgi:hypothetical protein